jgi:hypothetical protein
MKAENVYRYLITTVMEGIKITWVYNPYFDGGEEVLEAYKNTPGYTVKKELVR